MSGKGRRFRGRSSYSGSLSGKQHPFRNAPQPGKSPVAKSHRNWYVPCTDLEALVNDQRSFKAGQLQCCIALSSSRHCRARHHDLPVVPV